MRNTDAPIQLLAHTSTFLCPWRKRALLSTNTAIEKKFDPAHLGGTRHLFAAQFAHDQRNATALVASQDGQFTVFAWSSLKNMVHAHRLDALLI